MYNNDITGMPLYVVVHVPKGYMVNTWLTIDINYEDKTNYPSYIFTRCLID